MIESKFTSVLASRWAEHAGTMNGLAAIALLEEEYIAGSGSPMDDDVPGPLPNEPSISVDWQLPMTTNGQELFFARVRATFDKCTATIPVGQKKKYRHSSEELLKIRNICCFFDQLSGHLQTRMFVDQHQA